MTDRRKLLRDHTNHLHKKLDDNVGPLGSNEQYLRYLHGMLQFRHPLEQQIAASKIPAEFDDFVPSMISEEIESDLRSLDTKPIFLPASITEPQPFELSQLLGVLYVLEGSSLGAHFLVKQAHQLGFGEANGASHLAKQTSRKGNWKAFCALLEQIETIDEKAMTSAARTTFSLALDAFEKV
ncbi:biliverdin-producing heme oxygenase [Roseibium litorale]|uniref:Biliverdin-producing heme oxygenase n=1 Tax=Roseibium litorale TaxID=2803841 RepID=A0ABR9CMR3_9HYPH|nr:biliverdin-producing heme oxygenase [Roseibium litorale]MBD8892159.1 biliverdin-producing heme oxygenase [Roseibium litorale]